MGDYSKIIEQSAKKMPEMQEVKLLMTGLHLHANGVFSNVYRGILLSPGHQREIAIKKTWPKENKERNFEMVFLTGINRKKHKNIVQMLFAFTKTVGKNEICESFVFDFMPDTLASMIKKDLLNIIDIKLYTWQLFNGLLYLSSHYIVHRDIKPVNILVDHHIGLLKIGDFGSAKIVRKDVKSTCYQVTRFYRPPELLLESQYYKWTSDLWSGGCVVGEMLRQNVLFPGKNRKEQLRLIFNCLGSPTKDEIKSMKTPIQLEGKKIVGYGLIRLIPKAPPDMLDFLARVLVYSPQNRLGGKALLKDPIFGSIFRKGTRRSNGQLVAECITANDIRNALESHHNNQDLAVIMNTKTALNFCCSQIQRKNITSKSSDSKLHANKFPENQTVSLELETNKLENKVEQVMDEALNSSVITSSLFSVKNISQSILQ